MKAILINIAIFPFVIIAFANVHAQNSGEVWRQVEVIRTANGVPHVRAQNLRAAGYALAWLQLEDYGDRMAMSVLTASGRASTVMGYERIESDFLIRRERAKIESKYARLSKDVRDIYEGFAAGLNRFVTLHPKEFPAGMPADFTGFDVASTENAPLNVRKIRNFVTRLTRGTNAPLATDSQARSEEEGDGPDDGSNAWAFAPSRTKSGKAILLRNPHLQWNAGYYEAHVTVPGVIDFYGDFRIGGPFTVIGGFNKDLGFSTTNNSQDLDEFYSFDADKLSPDHFLLDGKSLPLARQLLTVPFRNGESLASETREFWSTPFGPVIHRANGKIYILKFAGDGENRAGEQFLKMMRAKTHKEWTDAMRMRARMTSNFTYADRAGNIYYLWNAALPLLPHPPTDDLAVTHITKRKEMWTELVPFDSLPQALNPPGGYVHNENSTHHYTNVRTPVVTKNAFPNFEEPRLSLRSQLAIELINGDAKFNLEDVVKLKHNYRALLADRVKADLLAAVRKTTPTGEVANAVDLLEKWDNTTSPESRGSVIFQEWWRHYSGIRGDDRQALPDEQRYAKVWSINDPFKTPSGLADPERAAESFVWAVEEVKKRYGRFDVAWGDVHRVRRGSVDVPVGGCGNDLGCFRIMGYTRQADGKFTATGGDGWTFAVEFGDVPRAYSVLAYGQSNRVDSPYHADQAEMFAKGEMKRVAFTEADIKKNVLMTFRPGEKAIR